MSTDITDRKAVEDVIRASENRLRAMMDNTSAVIDLKDPQGRNRLQECFVKRIRPWGRGSEVAKPRF
jgi:hypothetical protein